MMYEKVLVLGFYDRNNLGDESYKLAFPKLIGDDREVIIRSMDDIEEIPEGIDIVVCGGGDIINDYFMIKAQQLLKKFTGPVYAISVGIPYDSGGKYLHIFDHVFVRSLNDYNLATREIGDKNVSYCPDITWCLPSLNAKIKTPLSTSVIKLGLCLAQPAFYNNPCKQEMITSLVTAIQKFKDQIQATLEVHMLSFNSFTTSEKECDHVINIEVGNYLRELGIVVHQRNEITETKQMLTCLADEIDIALCMRYHSVVFSLKVGTPFTALFASQKVKNLLQDTDYYDRNSYHLSIDNRGRPTEIDHNILSNNLINVWNTRTSFLPINLSDHEGFQDIQNVVDNKKLANVLVTTISIDSFDDVLKSCKRNITKYLSIGCDDYDVLLRSRGKLPIKDKNPIEVARYLCYLISGRIDHPCLWGLSENMTHSDFCLYEAIDYIWKYSSGESVSTPKTLCYYPKPENIKRRVTVNLDFVFKNDFSLYHRSGWGYVVGGLMNFDAPHISRHSDIFLDTYVDRTFHWGLDIVKTLGVVPYTKPWYGFVHHTFDTTHSEYNCVELFKKPEFLESLKCCKGLLALTEYLAQQLRESLRDINMRVPVYVLYHPMEFVNNNFTMAKFLNNPRKAVVQIGAWLRNPYALYELPLSSDRDHLQLRKIALKGKEMEQYFSPPGFLDVMEETLLKKDWYHNVPHGDNRIEDLSKPICRPSKNTINKYCQGLFNIITKHLSSVEVVEKLSNQDYDNLLAENIVFLNLVDCSAVNTVIECIVRDTILVVNRLPALEEILGPDYPGFYESLTEAAEMCQDIERLLQIHTYMTTLNKSRYNLDFFLNCMQDIMCSDGTELRFTYDLFAKPTKRMRILSQKYRGLIRFLPNRFTVPT